GPERTGHAGQTVPAMHKGSSKSKEGNRGRELVLRHRLPAADRYRTRNACALAGCSLSAQRVDKTCDMGDPTLLCTAVTVQTAAFVAFLVSRRIPRIPWARSMARHA